MVHHQGVFLQFLLDDVTQGIPFLWLGVCPFFLYLQTVDYEVCCLGVYKGL